jgi:hypothetical protein
MTPDDIKKIIDLINKQSEVIKEQQVIIGELKKVIDLTNKINSIEQKQLLKPSKN